MTDRDRVVNRFWPGGVILVMADIGAAIYFVSHSNGSFWGVILGLLQAVVWPAYLVYHLLVLLHA